ncbi:MAG TPA: hypothetical protein VGN37_16285 [Actinocatenispora sp.]
MLQTVTGGIVALATVAAIGLVAGCVGPADKSARTRIKDDLKSYSYSADTSDPGKPVRDLAAAIRADAKDAGDDVRSAADALADDLDPVADAMSAQTSATTMSSHARQLGSACGTSMSVPEF